MVLLGIPHFYLSAQLQNFYFKIGKIRLLVVEKYDRRFCVFGDCDFVIGALVAIFFFDLNELISQ